MIVKRFEFVFVSVCVHTHCVGCVCVCVCVCVLALVWQTLNALTETRVPLIPSATRGNEGGPGI